MPMLRNTWPEMSRLSQAFKPLLYFALGEDAIDWLYALTYKVIHWILTKRGGFPRNFRKKNSQIVFFFKFCLFDMKNHSFNASIPEISFSSLIPTGEISKFSIKIKSSHMPHMHVCIKNSELSLHKRSKRKQTPVMSFLNNLFCTNKSTLALSPKYHVN